MDITLENFETEVLRASTQLPVVLQFWAPWSEPCKTLGAQLEALETEYAGRFRLARLNVEDNPEITTHFQVRSIPFVVAFVNGQPAEHFMGMLADDALRAFLDRFVPPGEDLPDDEPAPEPEIPQPDPATPRELEIAERVAANPGDLAARLALAELRIERSAWELAMDELLEIVARDRTFQDDIGRKTLLGVFEKAADQPAVVSAYRRRLSTLLF